MDNVNEFEDGLTHEQAVQIVEQVQASMAGWDTLRPDDVSVKSLFTGEGY